MSNWQPPSPGALDDTPWPETLIARAGLRNDQDDQLHGYSVVGDVARHFAHSDLVFLAIVGELPERRASAIFHVALSSLTVTPVNEAPCHVGILSRICGGTFASAIGAATIALADQTHALVARHADLLASLAQSDEPSPNTVDPSVAAIASALAERGVTVAALARAKSREAAQLTLLHAAGLQSPDQIEAAIVAARVTGIAAELLQTGPQHLRDYPVKLPPFHYVEEAQ